MSDIREPLWRAVTAADFLSEDEKRAALGYGPTTGGEGQWGAQGEECMTSITDELAQRFLHHADIGHLALLIWASCASAFVAFSIREAAEAARRAESFMQDFLQELSRFNRHHQEEEER